LVVVDDVGLDPRYRLLETIRQYARDRLVQSGEITALGNAHLDYFLALGREAEPRIVGFDQVVWLNRLDLEHDNLRAAIDLASPNRPARPTDWPWRRAGGGSGPSAATAPRDSSAWSARSRRIRCR
jgi:predicted ATPase